MNATFRSALIALVASCVMPHLVHGAEVSGPVTGGAKGAPFNAPAVDVAARGYVVEEFFLDGTAHGYELKDSATYSPDGQWATQRSKETAPFRTRILVVRPAKAADFNGTVIVHWQNVTAGYELGTVTDGEYLRGYAWVGVSAQKVGVDGFPGPEAAGLKQWDEERYASLNHPGDGFSYDIFTQAGRAVSPNRPKSGTDPMGALPVERLIAAGASQSAARLRTYINGVHPIENVFHAFIPYIDFGATIPFASDFGQQRSGRQTTLIREDLNVPVLVVNSETETVSYVGARQPDTAKFRFWEVAGASHVTVPRGQAAPGLESPNWLSYQPVYTASLRHTHHWLTKGVEPPRMPGITLAAGDTTAIDRDADGNARGGIRLPDMAVPTASHSGMGKRVEGGNRFAFLYGTAHDFTADRLAELYPTPEAFMAAYEKALKQSVEEGMILAEDAPALLETARAWSSRL